MNTLTILLLLPEKELRFHGTYLLHKLTRRCLSLLPDGLLSIVVPTLCLLSQFIHLVDVDVDVQFGWWR